MQLITFKLPKKYILFGSITMTGQYLDRKWERKRGVGSGNVCELGTPKAQQPRGNWGLRKALFHCMVRLGLVQFGLYFHCSLVPLYSGRGYTHNGWPRDEKRFHSASPHQDLAGSAPRLSTRGTSVLPLQTQNRHFLVVEKRCIRSKQLRFLKETCRKFNDAGSHNSLRPISDQQDLHVTF